MAQPPLKTLELSEADLARVARAKARHESSKVDPEWYFLALFGRYYGFDGVRAILSNEITMETAEELLKGAEAVSMKELYHNAQANLIGSASANAKKPGAAFKKSTADILKKAQVNK